MTKQYSDRDIMALDQAGDYYLRHVQAMTREQLHTKSDIAAELGHRDLVIEQLTAERDALAAQVEALQKTVVSVKARCNILQNLTLQLIQGAELSGSDWDYISEAQATEIQHHLRQVRADAGRDGFIAGYFHHKNYGFQFEEELEAASNQYQASILAGKE